MKRPSVDGGFVFCFLLNLILNAYWAIPAAVLLIAHFVVGTPLWAAWVALALWVLITLGITAFLSWAVSKGNANEEKGRYTRHSSSESRR